MPVKPPPMRYVCPKCGWSMVFAPLSDAMVPPPPSECEKCHNPGLKVSPAGSLDEKLALISRIFK